MIQCPRCYATNGNDWRNCKECGHGLPSGKHHEVDSPVERLVILQNELNTLDEIRYELHEIAKYNPQVEVLMQNITAKLWAITHKRREAI